MNHWEIIASFVFGLAVNEMTDLSPWAARRLVRWAAYRWATDPQIAAGYAEEWTALIGERPGKLFKLLTAIQFSVGAAGRAAPRILKSAMNRATRTQPAGYRPPNLGAALMLILAITLLGVISFGLGFYVLFSISPLVGIVASTVVLGGSGLAFLRWHRRSHSALPGKK
ncbi:hypothetical protein [Micromonospora sp. WMMD1155]|uniref:hypothetical protein n=1 Tax=Micromonospora sp. WMMD1155 TaxID=3016094 RepID=UPI00249A7C52|nr:hypothetical protein [Micromonospora sp. WMMD1155]WFE48836.1 hypothetical protein O7617_00210 [Micromonospora sp. WMMD1155]